MNTAEIVNLCQQLETARAELASAREAYASTDLGRHQKTISVCAAGHRVQVTDTPRSSGYTASLIRGREMILLGVKKVLAENVSTCESEIQKIERAIREAAS